MIICVTNAYSFKRELIGDPKEDQNRIRLREIESGLLDIDSELHIVMVQDQTCEVAGQCEMQVAKFVRTCEIRSSTSTIPLSTSAIPLSTSTIRSSTSTIPLSTSTFPLSTSTIRLSTSLFPLSQAYFLCQLAYFLCPQAYFLCQTAIWGSKSRFFVIFCNFLSFFAIFLSFWGGYPPFSMAKRLRGANPIGCPGPDGQTT